MQRGRAGHPRQGSVILDQIAILIASVRAHRYSVIICRNNGTLALIPSARKFGVVRNELAAICVFKQPVNQLLSFFLRHIRRNLDGFRVMTAAGDNGFQFDGNRLRYGLLCHGMRLKKISGGEVWMGLAGITPRLCCPAVAFQQPRFQWCNGLPPPSPICACAASLRYTAYCLS